MAVSINVFEAKSIDRSSSNTTKHIKKPFFLPYFYLKQFDRKRIINTPDWHLHSSDKAAWQTQCV
jgi:hypothetical protein